MMAPDLGYASAKNGASDNGFLVSVAHRRTCFLHVVEKPALKGPQHVHERVLAHHFSPAPALSKKGALHKVNAVLKQQLEDWRREALHRAFRRYIEADHRPGTLKPTGWQNWDPDRKGRGDHHRRFGKLAA